MVALANADNANQMISSCRNLVTSLFGAEEVEQLADDCIAFFVEHGSRNWNAQDSVTAKLYEILKKSKKGSILNKVVQAFIVTAPHSMQTERAIKCHTQFKTDLRNSMSRETVNCRMIIALNSSGTAYFDPRLSVAKFLTSKNRRNKFSDEGRCVDRNFTKHFFQEVNSL